MTAQEAIELYREVKATRVSPPVRATQHEWQDARRKPVPGGFRIYPIEVSAE